MTSGSKTLCRFPTSSPSACCHCPFFAQALIAELQMMTLGSKSSLCKPLRSARAAIGLGTRLNQHPQNMAAAQRTWLQNMAFICFAMHVRGGHLLLQAAGRSLSQFFVYGACPGGLLPLQEAGRSPEGRAEEEASATSQGVGNKGQSPDPSLDNLLVPDHARTG